MAEANSSLRSRWGQVADYFFGRNSLIGVASFMLLGISGYATWHGMSDFIIGVSSSTASRRQELPGGLEVSTRVLVVFIVVALTFLMWLSLRETFGAKRRFVDRLVTAALYIFLAIWSVGFGYGFWWSLIAGEDATRASLAGLQEDARDSVSIIAARLDAVRIELDNVVNWSDSQMAREAASGGTCGSPSGAGRGPLFGARQGVRDSVAALRDNITTSWLNPIKGDLEQLSQIASELQGATIAERQRLFEATAADIRGRARNIAARSNALGKSTAAEMRALGDSLAIAPGEKGFSCFDPTLSQRLKRTASQAEEPATLNLRAADFNEGPAGVANAIKSLWANIGTYLSSLGSYVASGGKIIVAQSASDVRITGRDLIALLATLGTDLGLLALTILNPPRNPPSLRPPGTVIRQINAALQTAIARAPGADLEWVRRHFIHHNKASYFIIPNLHSIDPGNEDESSKALAMNQLAGVLSDLDLARWPKSRELRKLRKEETVRSETDLSDIRKKWAEETHIDLKPEKKKRSRMRNHGLFSKAERALQIAGWSDPARNDIEIFRLVDAEGLTPLLMALNEASVPAAARPSSQAEPISLAAALGGNGSDTSHFASIEPPPAS
jgi:hypothetical protein